MRIFERDPVVFGLDHMAFLDLVHPEDRDAVLEEFEPLVQARRPAADRPSGGRSPTDG